MLSIIIPAYNEAKHLGRRLRRVQDYLRGQRLPHEIIVVDDGSKDATAKVARSVKGVEVISYEKNQGKGYAVRQGMLAAKGQHALFMDADLATGLEAIPAALREARTCDVVIGSRKMMGAKLARRQPLLRRVIGNSFRLFLKCLGMGDYRDTQCGFKLFSRRAAQDVFSKAVIDGFAFDVEALYLARRHGYTVHEMPITWKDDPNSSVRPFIDGTRVLLDVLSVRALHSKGLARRLAGPLRWLARTADRFLTYAFFSGIATATDFLILLSLTELAGVHYLLSAAIGYLSGMVVHYALNKRHTFANRSRRYAEQFSVHVLVALTGLAFHQALLYALVDLAGLWYVWGKVIATAVVLFWNYKGHSKLTFRLFK